MRITTVIVALLGLWMSAAGAKASVRDSVGMTVIEGREYVVYRVDPGDNLTMISGRFGTTVAEVRKANRLYDPKVKVGQILYIPYDRPVQEERAPREEGLMRGETPNPSLGEEVVKQEGPKEEENPLEKDKIEVSLRDVLQVIREDQPVVEEEIQEEPQEEVAMEIVFGEWENPDGDEGVMRGEEAQEEKVVKETPNTDWVEEMPAERPEPQDQAKELDGGGQEKVHVVEAGQTLYAISRQYGVSVAKIKEWNQLESDALNIGQKLIVAPGAKVSNPAPKPVERASRSHTVEAGETLYAISRMYDVPVADLKSANNLEENALSVGQVLSIPGEEAPKQPGKSLMDSIDETVDPQPQEVAVNHDKFTPVEVLSTSAGSKLPANAKTTPFTAKSGKKYLKVEEKGEAASIDDFSTDQTRFFCFHSTLPKGAYLRVDNPDKGQSILVEVVGPLPEDATEIIQLTAKSREYLRLKEGGTVVLRYLKPE